MWQKPWKLREGIAIGCGLLVIGAILQLITGGILWQLFAFPANALALLIYLLLIGTAYWMREKVYFIRYLMSTKSAATSMLFVVGLTFIMGLTRQVPSGNKAVDPIGLTNMLSFWPFVLIYLWMTTTVGLATLQRLVHFKKQRFASVISHLGLFIVVVCGTLGSADIQKLKMYCLPGEAEWRAMDEHGHLKELPIAIELNRFILEKYPAELQKVRADKGQTTMMKIPTPKRYASEVEIYTEEGDYYKTTIEVNKPFSVNGWKIYQFSYDERFGKNNTVSIFELITDPWLPFVYIGIGMMLLGALLMFFKFGKETLKDRKENDYL